jgi:HEAT repeat protein
MSPKIIAAVVAVALVIGVFAWLARPGGERNVVEQINDTETEPEKRKELVRQLDSEDEQQREALIRLVDDPHLPTAMGAVNRLGRKRTEENRRALKEVVRKAKHPIVRGKAAEQLGGFENTTASELTALLKADQVDDPAVRAGAARGLRRLKDDAAIPELLEALNDPDKNVRMWAISAIRALVPGKAWPFHAEAPASTRAKEIANIRYWLKRYGKL